MLPDLIESVLDFASIEAGRLEVHPVVVAVEDQIEDCLAFIGPMAADRMLTLRTVKAHGTPKRIVTDPKRLRQVLLNLLGNAVKYTPSGGVELRVLPGIGASSGPERLRIEVADTGPGIEEASRDRLFQDFERSESVTSLEGAGLGLAIAARIMALLKGTVGYTPNPGGGSVFWLELPVEEIVEAPPPRPIAAAIPQSVRSVLLVEDVAMNRDVIGSFLKAAGHQVTMAENGREAVALASTTLFDLILMDIRMPEMDGLQATRCIRALAGPPGQIPIIALTAYAFPEQVAQCREVGMNGHVPKPVDYPTLVSAIAELAPGKSHNETSASVIVQAPNLPPPVPLSKISVTGSIENSAQAEGRRSGPSRLDRARLDETLGFLPPESIQGHLISLRERAEQMLRLFNHPDAPALAEAAHTLASTSGMFGLSVLSKTARDFEHVLMGNALGSGQLAQRVEEETRLALDILDGLIPEYRIQLT